VLDRDAALLGEGRSVSAASSAVRDKSTCSRAKDRWSARLSRSRASVRSIARVFTCCRRSISNEPWHYELRPDAADHGCPSMYADASHDPRLKP
jgi:hypothetical protein